MRTLVTKRLFLRDLKDEDLDAFYNYAKKPMIGPMAGWLPHETIEFSFQIMDSMRKQNDVWAIALQENNLFIGTIGFHQKDKSKPNEKEIGYALNDTYWGQGLVPEAVKAVIDYGFLVEDLDKIWCAHFDFNNQSKRVIEKSGFIFSHTELVPNAHQVLTLSYRYYLNNPYRGERNES